LARAGLDHLDICCLSVVDEVHNGLAGDGDRQQVLQAFIAARKHGLCAVAQVALVRPTLATIHETLDALAGRGVRDVGLFAIATTDEAEAAAGALRAEELPPVARLVEETAERLGVRLLWYPTLRFVRGRPLGQQACGGPRCSGDTAIRVEPDGSVIPPRGPYVSAGNLLIDDWETIERSEVFQNYRRRVESDTHCDQCPGLAICAADCPRNPAGWAEGGRNRGVS
jgi:radical SAM protein with 4Fe4S-binding SPASM domain